MPGKPRTTLPAFAPVPRAKDRHNGWKPEVQRAFIEALAETGSVRAAARRVGRAEVGAYLLRRHPQAHEFRKAWDAALDIGMRRIEDVAMDRALHGVVEPVYSYGKLVGTRVRYNDQLIMFMLRNRAGHRFAAGGAARALSASDKGTLRRLRKEWRAEWERERAALDHEEEQDTFDGIDRFIEQMRDRRHASMSPRARAAYEEYRRIEAEDGVAWMIDDDEADPDDEPLALASPPEPEPGPEPPTGPRIRTIKGEWD